MLHGSDHSPQYVSLAQASQITQDLGRVRRDLRSANARRRLSTFAVHNSGVVERDGPLRLGAGAMLIFRAEAARSLPFAYR